MQGDTGPWVSPDSLHVALVLRTSLRPSLNDLSSLDTRVAVVSLSNASVVTSIPRPEASHCQDCGLVVSLAILTTSSRIVDRTYFVWANPGELKILDMN